VTLPEPVPGLVIRYAYLWYSEYEEGREEGTKDRPCAIVAAIRLNENGETRVLVLPITHSPPERAQLAVEIPQRVKERLGLDADRSWAVLSEWNEFTWPGPDLRPVPGADDRAVAYGFLPPRLFAVIREKFLSLIEARAAERVQCTE